MVIAVVCASALLLTAALAQSGLAQKALTWQEIRDKFEAANPSLRAGQIGVDESRANETTAYLRPNPNLALLADQIDPFPGGPAHGTFSFFLPSATVTYSARTAAQTRIAPGERARTRRESRCPDKRTWSERCSSTCVAAFVQTLQQKAVLDLAKENLVVLRPRARM